MPVRDETGAVAPFCDATVCGGRWRRELDDPTGCESIMPGFFQKFTQPNEREKLALFNFENLVGFLFLELCATTLRVRGSRSCAL